MTTTETGLTKAQQLTAAFRAIADMLETNAAAGELASSWPTIHLFYPNSADEHAIITRAALAAGAKVDKDITDEQYNLKLRFGIVTVHALAWRSEVCERVVVGTEQVTKKVKDPALLAEVPEIEVTETVEHVEWVCSPLLANDTKAVA